MTHPEGDNGSQIYLYASIVLCSRLEQHDWLSAAYVSSSETYDLNYTYNDHFVIKSRIRTAIDIVIPDWILSSRSWNPKPHVPVRVCCAWNFRESDYVQDARVHRFTRIIQLTVSKEIGSSVKGTPDATSKRLHHTWWNMLMSNSKLSRRARRKVGVCCASGLLWWSH